VQGLTLFRTQGAYSSTLTSPRIFLPYSRPFRWQSWYPLLGEAEMLRLGLIEPESDALHVRTMSDVHSAPEDQSAFRLLDVRNAAVRSALAARFPFLRTLDLQYQTLFVEDLAAIALEFNCIETLNLRSGSMFAHMPLRHDDEHNDHYDEAQRRAHKHSAMMSSATAFSNIRGLGNLVELNLKDNKLYEDAAHHVLANLPQQFPKLQVLDLSDQGLYSVGYKGLIRALPGLPSLRRLVLQNTHLEDQDMPFLARALGSTPVLEELDLRGNYIAADKVELLRAHGAPAALLIRV
jgi:hypothetical protein